MKKRGLEEEVSDDTADVTNSEGDEVTFTAEEREATTPLNKWRIREVRVCIEKIRP